MSKIDRLFRKEIEDIPVYIPGKPIEEVQRMLGLKRIIKLASNENPLGPSPKAAQAIKKCLGEMNRYPDAASWYLKAKIATTLKLIERLYRTTDGKEIGPDAVLLLSNADIKALTGALAPFAGIGLGTGDAAGSGSR